MNFEYFIARRFIGSPKSKTKASSSISKIGIVSIALGLAMMLIATSIGKGLQREIKNKLVAFNGHIQLSYYDSNNSEVAPKPIEYNSTLESEIKSIQGVKDIYKVATKGGVIRTTEFFEGVLAKGVDENYVKENISPYLVEGESIFFSSDKINNQALISKFLSKRLHLKLGDKFQILFFNNDNNIPAQRYMTVSGIYNSGFQEFDSNFIFIDLRHIQHINHWGAKKVGHLEIFVNDIKNSFDISKEIYNVTPSDVDTKTIGAKYEVIMKWLNLMDYNIYIIIAIMIIVGGVNMITTMLITVLEKIRTIGLLKAIGANNYMIGKIYIYQSIYLIGLGLFFGNLLGLGLLFLQSKYGLISLNPEIYYVSKAPVYITTFEIVILNIGTLVLCSFMLLIPSYVISKISPIKAIHTN